MIDVTFLILVLLFIASLIRVRYVFLLKKKVRTERQDVINDFITRDDIEGLETFMMDEAYKIHGIPSVTILVKELLDSKNGITSEDASKLYNEINYLIREGYITIGIDFDGMDIISGSFFGIAIAQLRDTYPKDFLNRKLKFINLDIIHKITLKEVLDMDSKNRKL